MTPSHAADPDIRRSGIGASDAAAALGLSPWGGPHDIYMEKRGMSVPLVETQSMRWGKLLEEPIAREVAATYGWQLRRDNRTLRHPSHPWMFTHLDRRAKTPDGVPTILEIKTASAYRSQDFGEPGTDQVPAEYRVQVEHELAVTGVPRAYLSVLIGGNRLLAPFEIYPDRELTREIIEIEEDLWLNHIVPGIPPDPDGSEGSGRLLYAMFPNANGETITADERFDRLAARYRAAEAALAKAQRAKDAARDGIENLMGPVSRVQGTDYRIHWTDVAGARVPNWRAIAEELMQYAPVKRRETVVADHIDVRKAYRRFSLDDRS